MYCTNSVRPRMKPSGTTVLTGYSCEDFPTRTKRQIFINILISPIFLNTGRKDNIFQQSGKQGSARHIFKSSACMYGSSSSQFFRTTTGIQSRPDVFEIPRSVMTFLTNLRVKEILCSYRGRRQRLLAVK